jgi:fatty-acyl-CoA synthase
MLAGAFITMSEQTYSWDLPSNDLLTKPEQTTEIEKTPLESRNLPTSIYAVVQFMAEKYGQKTALKYLPNGLTNDIPVEISHADLLEKSTQTANLLHDLGVGKDDTVAIISPDIIETMYSLLGAETAGIALPVQPYIEPEQMVEVINKLKAKVLIVFGFHSGFDTWRKFQLIKPQLTSVEHFVVINTQATSTNTELDFKWLDFHTEIDKQPADKLKSDRVISPSDIALYANTSGTTGTPKTVKRTHGNQVFFIWSQISSLGIEENECTIHGFPLCDRDLIFLAHMSAFAKGGTTIILGPRGFTDPNVINHYWNIVNKYQATSLLGSPIIIQQLLNSASIEGKEFKSVKSMIYSGQRLSPALYKKFKEKTNIKLLQTFAMAESTFIGTHYLNDTDEIDCIGLRNAYIELKVVNVDSEGQYINDCNDGETGVLFMRGPNVSKYLDEKLNDQRWTNDGWLNTGDLVKKGSAGKFHYIGRSLNQVRINGTYINPEIIENELNKNSTITESIVVNMPHHEFNEIPAVYVSMQNNNQQEETKSFIHQFMGENYSVPSEVVFQSDLKKATSGKIDRVSIACDAIQYGLENQLKEEISRLNSTVTIDVSTNTVNTLHAKINITSPDDDLLAQAISHTETKLELASFDYSIN